MMMPPMGHVPYDFSIKNTVLGIIIFVCFPIVLPLIILGTLAYGASQIGGSAIEGIKLLFEKDTK